MKLISQLLLVLGGLALFTLSVFGDKPAEVMIEVHLQAGRDYVDFLANQEQIARYHTGSGVARPYLWPLRGPGGVSLTRSWPMEKAPPGGSTDHPHQKSAWFCHGDLFAQDIPYRQKSHGVEGVDFWSESQDSGRIVCNKIHKPTMEKNHGSLRTQNSWLSADGVKILDERRDIHFYNFGDTRLFVFEIDLEAKYGAVTFGDTKEGSFGVRVNDVIREEKGNGKIENADGKIGEKECWGRLSAWCDYSGVIDGKTAGLAVLADPANPYPSCWHSRGYGLMAANPFGRAKSGFPDMKGRTDLVKLAKGEHLKLRYGLLLHPGDAKKGKVADYFQRFVKLKE
jgi:hypothetical protein